MININVNGERFIKILKTNKKAPGTGTRKEVEWVRYQSLLEVQAWAVATSI